MTSTIITLAIAGFLGWNERAKLVAAAKKVVAITPGLPGRSAQAVTRQQAVAAVETLVQYSAERDNSEQVEHHALAAGRALWDCDDSEVRE